MTDKTMRKMRRNAGTYWVLGARHGLWRGFDSVDNWADVHEKSSFFIACDTHQKADESAAMSVGEGLSQWTLVEDERYLPVSHAGQEQGTLVVTAKERYGVNEEDMFEALRKAGEAPAILRRIRETALARPEHTPERIRYASTLVHQWAESVRDGRIKGDSAAVGFEGPAFEYGKTRRGWELLDPVSLGVLEISMVAVQPATIIAMTSYNARVDKRLTTISAEAFADAWYVMMGFRYAP